MKRRLWAALLLVSWLTTACSAPVAVDHEQISRETRLVARFSHVTAVNSPKHLAAVRFADGARERTHGRVEIQVYPNSELYGDGDELAALKDGAIQFIAATPSKLTALEPSWQVFDLPYLFRDFADVERLFESPAGLKMRERLVAKGFLPLAVWPNGFKQLTNNRRPLVRPQDFQGLTFRVQPGQVLQDQFLAVGATTGVKPFDSVYAEIERGQVDGQENTPSNIYTRNLQEVQPYLTISDHGYLGYVVLTQVAWWNSLEPDVREALQEALADASRWIRENAQAINEDHLRKIIASGLVQVRVLTPEERSALRVAFQPAYRAAAERLGADFINQVLIAAGRAAPQE